MTNTEKHVADLARLAASGVSSIDAARATGLTWDKVFSLANRNGILFADLAPEEPAEGPAKAPARLVPDGVRAPLTPTEMPSAGIMDEATERALLARWQRDGDRAARDRLLHHHEPLVRTMALHAARRGAGTEALMDLIQEARGEILAAINSHDHAKGARLCTYAGRRVQAVLNRWIMDFHCQVRVGTNLADKNVFYRFSKARRAWEAKNERPLDEEGVAEVAAAIRVPVSALRRMMPRMMRQDISIDTGLCHAGGFRGNGDSTDAMRNFRSVLKDLVQPSPDEEVIARLDGETISRLVAAEIAKLPARERAILMARMRGRDLAEIGLEHGITKERVGQIQRKTQRRMKARMAELGIEPGDLVLA